ncbi:E3 ubiquitin-protein ligase chfr, partial [Clonorchis sinensis]
MQTASDLYGAEFSVAYKPLIQKEEAGGQARGSLLRAINGSRHEGMIMMPLVPSDVPQCDTCLKVGGSCYQMNPVEERVRKIYHCACPATYAEGLLGICDRVLASSQGRLSCQGINSSFEEENPVRLDSHLHKLSQNYDSPCRQHLGKSFPPTVPANQSSRSEDGSKSTLKKFKDLGLSIMSNRTNLFQRNSSFMMRDLETSGYQKTEKFAALQLNLTVLFLDNDNHVSLVHPRVSEVHCFIMRDPDGTVWLCDTSEQGTLLNRSRLLKNEQAKLCNGDSFHLFIDAADSSSDVGFILELVENVSLIESETTNSPGLPTRKLPAASSSPILTGSVLTDLEVENCLTCVICGNVFFECCSLQPCLHSFCTLCWLQWRQVRNICPVCRQPVSGYGKNHQLNQLIELYLKQNPGMVHETCACCGAIIPKYQRDSLEENKVECEGCGRSYCNLIAPGGCSACMNDCLTPISRLAEIDDLPLDLLLGNHSETRILKDYLREHDISNTQFRTQCLNYLDTNMFPGRVATLDTLVCRDCGARCLSHMVYQCRAAIPSSEFPETVTSRPNCYYGRFCRTQRTNAMHAVRYNHIYGTTVSLESTQRDGSSGQSVNLLTGRSVVLTRPQPLDFPSRLGQPGSIPAFVLPSGGMAARHQNGSPSMEAADRSAVTPFRCLAAMPPEGSTRAEILPGCPSLDRGSREAEVGFEPRTFRSNENNHSAVAPFRCLTAIPQKGSTWAGILPGCPSLDRGSREAKTEMKSIAKSLDTVDVTRLPGLGPHDFPCEWPETLQDMATNRCLRCLGDLAASQCSCFVRVEWQTGTEKMLHLKGFLDELLNSVCGMETRWLKWLEREFTDGNVCGSNQTSTCRLPLYRLGQPSNILALWLKREFTDRKVRVSNPTSTSRLPLSRLGQPGSIPALVQPSGGMAARDRKGTAAGRFFFMAPTPRQTTR